MKNTQNIGLVGIYTITKKDRDGNITDKRVIKNMVVSAGLETLAQAIGLGGTIQPISHIAVGTGDAPVSPGDTDLDELLLKLPKGTQSISGPTVYISKTFDYSQANGEIKELGMFVDETILFSRISTENNQLPITKHNNETMTIDYQLNFLSI